MRVAVSVDPDDSVRPARGWDFSTPLTPIACPVVGPLALPFGPTTCFRIRLREVPISLKDGLIEGEAAL
jgi:hypothetical protein